MQSAYAASADDACYHNVIRDALNTGKTMNNLWDGLTQKSHNFATEIRPSPSLPFLSNDSSLRNSAASVASSCSWGHSGYPDVGENLYYITEKSGKTAAEWSLERNGTVERAVNTWAYEAVYYSQSSNSCQSGEQCGHYTQMVWNSSVASGPTTKVGCVAQFCSNGFDNTGTPGREATYIVCHYKPAGNYPVAPYSGTNTYSGSSAAPISGCNDGLGGSSGGGSGGLGLTLLPIIQLLLND